MNKGAKTRSDSWWSRRCGGREVFALALPLIISMMSWTVMLFCDRMFLMWYSSEDMAAAMTGGMLQWTMICFPVGMASYVSTFVAQYFGAGRPERIGRITWQGMRIGLYTTPLFLLAGLMSPWLFQSLGHAEELVHLETAYFQTLTIGSGAAVLAGGMSSFFTGLGRTRVVMVVNALAAGMNVLLDIFLIFGKGGLPELGIVGAGAATCISQWLVVVAFGVLMCRPKNWLGYHFGGESRRRDWPLFGRLVKFGMPSGFQMLIESSVFSLFLIFIGGLGEIPMAASTLAFTVNMAAFIPMVGLGIAVSILVGQQLGRDRADLATRATWTAAVMAFLYTGAFSLLYLGLPDMLLWGHASGAKPEEFEQLRPITIVLLRFVAVYCFFDAMQLVFVGAIKGAGDTAFVLWATAATAAATLTIGIAGAKLIDGELYWWWSMVTLWIVALCSVFFVRFLQGHWRTMRVIEDEQTGDDQENFAPPSPTPAGVGAE